MSRHIIGPTGKRSSYRNIESPSGGMSCKADTTSSVAAARSVSDASNGDCSTAMQLSRSKDKRQELPTMETFVPSIEATLPTISEVQYMLEVTDRIEQDEAFHLFKIRRAFSKDERSFILTAQAVGIRNAIRLGVGFGWSYEKPLWYLRLMIERREVRKVTETGGYNMSNKEIGQYPISS
jgi:hypothetical protein